MRFSARLAALAAGTLALGLPQPGHLGARQAACTELSGGGSFAWEVRDFAYRAFWIYQNPAQLWARGELSYTLANPATGREAACRASSSQLSDFFYGNAVYSCDVPDQGGQPLPLPTFRFNGYGLWRLQVNETWICSPGGIFIGTGTKDLPLSCNDTGVVENPDWEPGQPGNFYSTRYLTCDPLSTTLSAHVAVGV
ncbi:hypothetical protein RB595_008101 [Gaeumannomyces hyphopodioides]